MSAVGYDMKMTDRSRQRTYRALAGLLVAALLIGVTPPLVASKMVCKMDRPASAPEPRCGSCGQTPESGTVPSIRAASCCHFGAPSEAPTLSMLPASPLRALPGLDAQPIAPTVANGSTDSAAGANSALHAVVASARSLSPTRSTILRL
jgi:hypothetical protein